MIIQGASHFSPIKINKSKNNNDLYNLDDAFVGVKPSLVQSILAQEITNFLISIEEHRPLLTSIHKYTEEVNFYIFNHLNVSKIILD